MGRRRTGKASSSGETAVSSLTPNPEFESFATDEAAKALLDFPRPSEFPLRGPLLFQVTSAAVALLMAAESLANQGDQLTMTPPGASEVNEPPRSGLIS
jgi:hypothetical protein